jgi:hypothetical protein
MAARDLEGEYKRIVNAAAALLTAHGFKKRGTAFRNAHDGNVSIVEFQKSRESSADAVKFTVNLGVISGELLRRWDDELDISKETVWSAHLRSRIGDFLSTPQDFWWIIADGADTRTIEAEVCDLITSEALPFLSQHSTDADLVRLWRTGQSPGLTEGQRERNLAKLTDALRSVS